MTAAYWFLLRQSDLIPAVFLCRYDKGAAQLAFADFGAANKQGMANFPGRRYVSYSFANPYPSHEATQQGWVWTSALPATFALAADLNPGSSELLVLTPANTAKQLRAGNSPNHTFEGQNVLYADGSLRFTTSPFSGWPGPSPRGPQAQDNIYTAGGMETLSLKPPVGGLAVMSPPLTQFDSVLLPTADAPLGPEPSRAVTLRYWTYIGIPGVAIGAALILLFAVVANRSRQRKLERGELPEMPA